MKEGVAGEREGGGTETKGMQVASVNRRVLVARSDSASIAKDTGTHGAAFQR
jgi:hypothetical protein